MCVKLNENATYIISRLESHGFSADIVGGSVRDFLLGKEPNDFDITTNATPDEMRRVFSDLKTVDTGIMHGTLTVVIDKEPYEVTTYRLDGEYSDGRHPDTVSFAKEIKEDLSRRDFTVNAMAYNPARGLTDLFGGRTDLDLRLIRAVGDPRVRFSEDALRILRALRFASSLGFNIEENTAIAVKETRNLLSRVSMERIFAEWKKLIAGTGACHIISEFSEVIEVFLPEISGFSIPSADAFDLASPDIRELLLFHTAGRSSSDYEVAMTRLRSDGKRKKYGSAVLSGMGEEISDEISFKKLLINYGADVARGILELKVAFGILTKDAISRLDAILSSGTPYRISDLAVSGTDLLGIGLHGSQIGDTLKSLLIAVSEGLCENNKNSLLDFVSKNA